MNGKLLTPEEAAKRLAISPRTLREWLRAGKLKGVKMGSLWRIAEHDLDAFIEANKTK